MPYLLQGQALLGRSEKIIGENKFTNSTASGFVIDFNSEDMTLLSVIDLIVSWSRYSC